MYIYVIYFATNFGFYNNSLGCVCSSGYFRIYLIGSDYNILDIINLCIYLYIRL